MNNELSRNEFKVLTAIERSEGAQTQRNLAKDVKLSVGTVNKILSELTDKGLVCDSKITDKGLRVLEPYRVKRAILLAAGFGERLVPITLNTPKPLVRVHGERIIDSLIDAIIDAGIEEIYIVRGYLAEQFDQLLYKYPQIKFLENPIYNEANNISSMNVAVDVLENAYVIESDFLLRKPPLITKYQYESNYLAIPMERSDDWCFDVKQGQIKGMFVGGTDCYQMCGISYWTSEDGKKLKEDIPKIMETPGGRERFWDEVPLRYCADGYKVGIRECAQDDLIEVDTFRELQELDHSYANKEKHLQW